MFYFWKGKSAVQTVNKICKIYGVNAIAKRTVQKWYSRFRSGPFNVEDQHRSSKNVKLWEDEITRKVA